MGTLLKDKLHLTRPYSMLEKKLSMLKNTGHQTVFLLLKLLWSLSTLTAPTLFHYLLHWLFPDSSSSLHITSKMIYLLKTEFMWLPYSTRDPIKRLFCKACQSLKHGYILPAWSYYFNHNNSIIITIHQNHSEQHWST